MMKPIYTILLAASCLGAQCLQAQSPGLIVRPAGGNGITALNPNGNAYASATTTGFTTDDIAQSELAFKVVPAAITEPTGDLSTGPSGGFTDIVTRVDGSGFYLYKDATNIYFRLRIGGIIAGSKGYSVLIDTDGKLGSTGPDADPNYVAPAGSSPGNPGFEYEVVLQTNFQVAVYNMDGTATPGTPATYALSTHSQIAVALSTDGNNPDYFYDWFIPLSAIGNPASIRLATTTVTSPNSALQGTRSDIYGINDAAYASVAKAWQTVAEAQPAINLSSFTGVSAVCTAPPVVTGPILTGSNIVVAGTWTRLDATKPSTATITLYKNGVAAGTTTVTSGNTWNITAATVATGDVLYARAQAAGETQCLQSNTITAQACVTPPAIPVLSCASTKGISGSMVSGATVSVYLVPVTSASPTSNQVSNGTNMTYPTAASFAFVSNGCTASPSLATGTYLILVSNNGCTSAPRFECITSGNSSTVGLTTNALTITQPLYPYQTSISGSGSVLNDILRLYINGKYLSTITATGTTFSFTGVTLQAGDQVQIYSQSSTACMTQSAVFTVACFTPAPAITTNATGNLLSGATSISGTSAYAGASVQLYKGTAPSGVATGSPATVSANGTWSVAVSALTGGDTWYAVQTHNSCASAASAQANVLVPATCPTISGSYSDASTPVTGTMPSAFTGTIRLYLDGALIGSQNISAATAWSIAVPANTLYYNGVLSVTAQATGSAESAGCGTKIIGCTSPATPSISPTTSTINAGQTVNFSVNNVTTNSWYALLDNSGVSYATSSYKTSTGSFSLVSNSFNTPGTYNLKLSADALSGCPASFAAATITVQAVSLAVHFVQVAAKRTTDNAIINWTVSNESHVQYYKVDRSIDGINFQTAGTVSYQPATGTTNKYTFTDKALPNAANLFYRIVQVDEQGKYAYSNIVSCTAATVYALTLMPNPAIDHVTVNITAPKNEQAVIELLDVNGKRIFTQPFLLHQGANMLNIDQLGKAPRGNYILKVNTTGNTAYSKLLLQ
jgi:hypothetical protein